MFLCVSQSHNKIEKLIAIKKNSVEMLSITPITETMLGTEQESAPCCLSRLSSWTPDCHCTTNEVLPVSSASSLIGPLYIPVTPVLELPVLASPPITWMTAPYFNFRPLCLPRSPPVSPETRSHPPLCSHRTCWLNYNYLFTYFSLSIVSRRQGSLFYSSAYYVSHLEDSTSVFSE